VAEVIAAILVSPATHLGKVYELTGPRSQNMHGVAAEYSEALGRPIRYIDVPFDQWRDQIVRTHNLSEHVCEHFLTMARLHAANRYDRLTHNVETIIGRHATSIRDFVAQHKDVFDSQAVMA
jgi:NAD(P)H dehydrogenase (quinone)